MISPDKTFDYRVTVARSAGGRLAGRVCGTPTGPMLMGDHPDITVAHGTIAIDHSSPEENRRSHIGLAVGASVDAILREGDELRLWRSGMGGLLVEIYREGALTFALGAAEGALRRAGMALTVDPRANQTVDYGLARRLRDPACTVFWLDPDAPDFASVMERMEALPRTDAPILVAVSARDVAAGDRAMGRAMHKFFGATIYNAATCWVRPRGATCEEWCAYLTGLPLDRPADLFLRLTIDDETVDVVEGQDARIAGWRVVVAWIQTPGFTFDESLIGAVRVDQPVTVETLWESLRQLSIGLMNVRHLQQPAS